MVAIICFSLLYAIPAAAQVLEEITVTATKRGAVDIQSLGVAVYALTGDSLESKNQLDFE